MTTARGLPGLSMRARPIDTAFSAFGGGYARPVSSKSSPAASSGRAMAMVATAVTAFVVAVPAVAIAAIFAQATRGVVTVVDTPDGKREVFWRDYPGIARKDPSKVLTRPSLEQGEQTGVHCCNRSKTRSPASSP